MMKRNEISFGKKLSVWICVLFLLIGSIGIVPINAEASTKKYVKKITLSETELELEEGESEQIRYKVYVYKGASKKIKLKVSDVKVISAKVKGNKISVYAKSVGESEITVISKAKNRRGKKIAKRIKVYVDEVDDDDLDYDYDDDTEVNNSEQSTTSKQPESKQATNDQIIIEQPTSEQSSSGQLTNEQSTGEKTTSEKITNEQTINETLTSEQLTSEQPISDQKTSEQLTSEQRINEQMTSEQPINVQPQREEPATGQEPNTQEITKQNDTTLPVLKYQVNIKNDGWLPSVKDGVVSGKTASSKPIESFKLYLKDSDGNSAIRYRAHIIGDGWQDSWKKSGNVAGTEGKSKYLDAFKVAMTEDYKASYDVYYRAYVQGYGWLGWAHNGEIAGSTGTEMPIEAIVVKVVKKGTAFDVGSFCYMSTPKLTYQAHVEDVGWQAEVGNASTAGTTGQSKAMEAIKITFNGFDGKNAITYNSHLANKGWQGWKNGGEISGTTGERRQMEAIQIKLNSTMSKYYDIYYRMHVQDKGWLGWAANGEPSGTVYGGLRAEAIQIRIVTKGSKFDRNGTAYYELPPVISINGDTVANIAKNEVGYVSGSGNNNKYGSYFGHNNTEWCAYFVAWCMKSAGVSNSIYNYSSSNLGCAVPNENVKSGKWHHGRGFVPKAGDLIYIDWCGKCDYPEHVELVTGCNNNTIYTVSGNSAVSGGRGVIIRTWNVNDTRIKGICEVDYSGNSASVSKPRW